MTTHVVRRLLLGLFLSGVCACTSDGGAPASPPQAPQGATGTPTASPPAPSAPTPTPEAIEAPSECATAEQCHALATAQLRAHHVEHAVTFYARACELGDGASCYRVGEFYRDGEGVTPDDDQARAMFTLGCQLGSTAACDALGH